MVKQHTKKSQKFSSKFIKVKCTSCGNEQVICGVAKSRVVCLVCNQQLVEPTAHKVKLINATLVKEM
jgi:ribosomal protein S27E